MLFPMDTQILAAIYNNPNTFIAKNVIREKNDEEEGFVRFVEAQIQQGQAGAGKKAKKPMLILKLNPQCTLKFSRQIIVDPDKKVSPEGCST